MPLRAIVYDLLLTCLLTECNFQLQKTTNTKQINPESPKRYRRTRYQVQRLSAEPCTQISAISQPCSCQLNMLRSRALAADA